jgi:hypothetical protein
VIAAGLQYRVVVWRLCIAIFDPGWRNCERNSFGVLLMLCVASVQCCELCCSEEGSARGSVYDSCVRGGGEWNAGQIYILMVAT